MREVRKGLADFPESLGVWLRSEVVGGFLPLAAFFAIGPKADIVSAVAPFWERCSAMGSPFNPFALCADILNGVPALLPTSEARF